MKKILIALFILSCTSTIFAQVSDAYRYDLVKKQTAGKTDARSLARREVWDSLIKSNPTSFDQIKAKVTEIYAKHKLPEAECVTMLCSFTLWNFNQKFVKESYQFAKNQDDANAVHAVYWYRDRLNITDQEAFEIFVRALTHRGIHIARKQQCCDRLLELAPALDAKLVKDSLTYLNRALTPKLMTTEKGQYEPMVAKIRTMLGAY